MSLLEVAELAFMGNVFVVFYGEGKGKGGVETLTIIWCWGDRIPAQKQTFKNDRMVL